MTVQELADLIRRRIDEGTLDPDAVVVRPFCLCDEESGFVDAQHLDEVIRTWEPAPGVSPSRRIYKYGNADPGGQTEKTVKLG